MVNFNLGDINIIIAIIAGIIVILGGVFGALKWGRNVSQKFWHFLTRYRPRVPRETVRILQQMRENWWSMGSIGGKPAMQIVGHWYVTNITGDPVLLLRTYIKRPRTEGHVMVQHPERNIYGRYPIPPGHTAEVATDYWIVPPLRKEREDFKAGIVLIDQFGNEHKLRKVIFRGPKPKQQKPGPLRESMHRIDDPIEKEVSAVLKAEVNRYQECGRRVGGLGSVQTTYQGHNTRGIGTEWRKADSPKNQSIVSPEETVLIESDNCVALLNLYHRLQDDEQKTRFVDALLKRLSRNTEYAPAGYLILLVLFRIGRLPEALKTAKRELQKDGAYGFSDFLQLLDGLLRFVHSSFTPELLDEIERFVEGVDEHTFRIEERLAAIRAFRLSKNNMKT